MLNGHSPSRRANHLPLLPNERGEFARAIELCEQGAALKNQALSAPSFQKLLLRARTENNFAAAELAGAPSYESFMSAMRKLQEALACYPRLPRAHFELGLCDLWLGRFASARTHLDAAALYSPNNLAILTFQGEALLELGQWNDAVQAFKKLAALEPESGRANLGLAKAYAALQTSAHDCQAGLDALERAAQLGAGDDPALRAELMKAFERFERGEIPPPPTVIRGNKPRPHTKQPAPSPWEGTIFYK